MALTNPETGPRDEENKPVDTSSTNEDYVSRFRSGNLPGQKPQESQAPEIVLPGAPGEIISREKSPDVIKDDAEKREEERRRIEEEKQPKFTDRRGKESSVGGTPIIGNPEARPATAPKIITGTEQKSVQPEPKPAIEVVSGFGNKPTPEDANYRKNIVQGVAERTDVREQIQRGEIPTAAELARLSESERGAKKETQETVTIRTGEQQEQDEVKAEAEAKKGLEDKLMESLRQIKKIEQSPDIVPGTTDRPYAFNSAEKPMGTLSRREAMDSFLREAAVPFEKLKGQKLETVAEVRARQEAAQEGLRIMTKQEYLARENDPARMEKRMAKIRGKQNELALNTDWQLSQENPQRYGIKQYETFDKFKEAVSNKKAELEKNGISLPDGVLEEMINQGYRVDEIKVKKSWFGFGKAKAIEVFRIPLEGQMQSEKKGMSFRPEEFASLVARTAEDNRRRDAESARFEINTTLSYGQRTWKSKKEKCTKDLLGETVEQIEESRKPKVAERPKAAERPKLEIFTRVGQERTPEFIKEMERIKKEVDAEIAKREKIRKQLADLTDKKKKGRLLTSRELAILKAYSGSGQEMKEAA